MATYYVELDGGQLQADAALKGGTMSAAVSFSGAVIYPSQGGGGGGCSMQTKSVSYTPSETAISASVTPDPGYDGLDRVNVSVDAISPTYVGSGVTRRSSSDLTASGATTTAPSGYYESAATKTIPDASVSVGAFQINSAGDAVMDVSVDSPGYVSSDFQLTEEAAVVPKAAATYHPATTDQTIASGQYLNGAQTIKAVTISGLSAANIVQGVTVEIGDADDPDRIISITGTAQTGGDWMEETISTSGAVTKALDPYVLYHFTGALTSLTITLNAPSAGQIAHYHFDFLSGSTAPTLTMPNTVTMPDSFAVEASKRYEVDVLNNYGSVIAWTE